MSSARWYLVGVIALVMVTATGPGQVITLVADCYWQEYTNGPVMHSTTQSDLVVRSPVSLVLAERPVFLSSGYQRPYKTRDGNVHIYTDLPAAGMLIRTYAWDEGQIRLVDGVLMSDGRVMVDGRALQPAEAPNG